MQDVENNMDELFRKAAVNYPLKDAEDDWDDIAALIREPAAANAPVKKENDLIRYNALLLMIALIFLLMSLATKDSLLWRPTHRDPVTQQVLLAGAKRKISAPTPDGIHTRPNLLKTRRVSEAGVDNNLVTISFVHLPPETISRFESARVLAVPSVDFLSADAAASVNKKSFPNSRHGIPGKRKPDIYLGFIAGPSFNQVKNQGLNKTGYDIGLIAGVQLNGRLSIESGLLFEKKYYFCNGKYFHMTKPGTGMPAGMKVLSLNGSSAIFEIPFKLKYDFVGNKQLKFFAAAGLSTYIMTNEYNKYRALISGTQQNITGNYHNTSNYFAASVDLSGGFEHKIGRSVNLRIEPYLQVPLRGIGIGSLHVLSTGIHLGMTIPAFR